MPTDIKQPVDPAQLEPLVRRLSIGDTYQIVENSVRITGTIKDISDAGYLVEWSDGTQTTEDTPSPAQ